MENQVQPIAAIEPLTADTWRKAITFVDTRNVSDIRKALVEYGVVLLKASENMKQEALTNSKSLTTQMNKSKGKVLNISGNQKMLSVNLKSSEFKIGEELIRSILDKGNAHYIRKSGGSFLVSRLTGITRQALHADSIVGNDYQSLIVLSDNISPTEFLIREKKEQKENIIKKDPERYEAKAVFGKIKNSAIREKVFKRFKYLFEKQDDSKIWPISLTPLSTGDIIIFSSDTIHRGAAWTEKKPRKLMFFTWTLESKKGKKVNGDYQFHGATAAFAMHGMNKDAFEIIHRVTDPQVEPPLYMHMTDEIKESYLRFIKGNKNEKN